MCDMAASHLLYMALLFQGALALDAGALDWMIMSPDGSQVKTNADIPLYLKQMMSSMIPRDGIIGSMPQTVIQEVKEETFVPNQESVLGAGDPYNVNSGSNSGLLTRVEDLLKPTLAPQPYDTNLKTESSTANDETEREPTTDLVQGMARKKRLAPFKTLDMIIEYNRKLLEQQKQQQQQQQHS